MNFNFIDLDFTIWRMDSSIIVIDKENPADTIINIDSVWEKSLKHTWKSYNLHVHYNGETFYLSKDIFDSIQKKKKLPLERIGLSYRNFFDAVYISKKIEFMFDMLPDLTSKEEQIYFLTARYNKDAFTPQLKLLKEEVFKYYKTNPAGYYFVGAPDITSDKIAYNKNIVLLEHLLGFKIEDNRLNPELKQKESDLVTLYDDESRNIDTSMQMMNLVKLIYNSSSDEAKTIIKQKIGKGNKILRLNKMTGNKLNPYLSFEIRLFFDLD